MKKTILMGLAAGLLNFFVSIASMKVFAVIFPGVNAEYQSTSLFRPYNNPLMLLFMVHPFLLSVILAWFWRKTKSVFGQGQKRIANFAFSYWLVATIPGMFATYTSMPYSFAIVSSWTIGNLLQALVAALVFENMDKN